MNQTPPVRRRRSPRRPRVHLTEVARAAEVSTATVSRALNSPERVSAEVRARVLGAAERLGYRPNPAARALAADRTHTVGAIVPTIGNSIFAPGIEAIQNRLEAADYSLLLAMSDYDPAAELRHARALIARGVDGLILIGRDHSDELRAAVARAGIPCVVQGAYATNGHFPCVGFDNYAAFRLAIAHLLVLGHRRVAVLSGVSRDNDRVRDRVRAARDALAEAGSPLADTAIVESRYDVREARAATRRLLALDPRPTAIACINDVLALGALFECAAAGVRVPDQISIVGFDDFDFAAQMQPALTTIRVPVVEMGEGAADYLLDRFAGRTPPFARRLDVELVVRGSTARCPAD
jgi:LacI family transcriptional regulator